MKYTVKQVSENPKEYETKYGKMKAYKVMLDNDEVVEINQKESTPAPTVGQELEGHIEEGEFGKKFKKEFKKEFSGGFPSQTKFTEDPGKQDSIIRQSSMKAAVDLVIGGQAKYEDVFALAESIVEWVKNEKTPSLDPLPEPQGEEENFMDGEISLDDIKF